MDLTQIVSIVDDDMSVRIATSDMVRSLGYPTLVFDSAEAFLASAHIDETACLLSDVRMLGMSGVEMHDRLLLLGRAPPTIFITAFPTPALQAKINAGTVLACFAKPVDLQSIADCLALVFGKP